MSTANTDANMSPGNKEVSQKPSTDVEEASRNSPREENEDEKSPSKRERDESAEEPSTRSKRVRKKVVPFSPSSSGRRAASAKSSGADLGSMEGFSFVSKVKAAEGAALKALHGVLFGKDEGSTTYNKVKTDLKKWSGCDSSKAEELKQRMGDLEDGVFQEVLTFLGVQGGDARDDQIKALVDALVSPAADKFNITDFRVKPSQKKPTSRRRTRSGADSEPDAAEEQKEAGKAEVEDAAEMDVDDAEKQATDKRDEPETAAADSADGATEEGTSKPDEESEKKAEIEDGTKSETDNTAETDREPGNTTSEKNDDKGDDQKPDDAESKNDTDTAVEKTELSKEDGPDEGQETKPPSAAQQDASLVVSEATSGADNQAEEVKEGCTKDVLADSVSNTRPDSSSPPDPAESTNCGASASARSNDGGCVGAATARELTADGV